MVQKRGYLLTAVLLCATLGGCGRGDDTGIQSSSTVAATVDFLIFPNPQPSLGTGDYDVVITNNAATPFNYTLTVTTTYGSVQTFTGTLANGASTTVSFEQLLPGGATVSLNNGGALGTLRLCASSASCTSSNDIAVSGSVANPSIELPRHQIDSTAYATAYYAAIDPLNERDTLAKFKAKNSFGTDCSPNGTTEFEVRFRDVIDLGYGRHLCVRGNTAAAGDTAAWVENFQVTAVPGQKYGPLNLEAVVTDDRRWHVGTNAIEYSQGPSGTGARFAKFYTFNPDGTRRLLVDLDGRGAKAMPVPCISCHGGHALPLTAAGLFPAIRTSARGDTLSRLQPLNVGTLDFSLIPPYRRADQEASLKAINQVVLCSYPRLGAAVDPEDTCRPASTNSEWSGTAAEMVKSWYGGNGMINLAFDDTFVPSNWTDATTGVTGSQNLYQTVVAPACRVCHVLRGNLNENGIDFTSYVRFADTDPSFGYNSRIKHHVFDRGNMPLALLKYEHFWESTAPTTLASFITGAMSGGSVLQPTRPVAKPGPDRTIVTGVAARLSAAESNNAVSYRWRITSANAANATLINANTIRPTFTSNVNGVYDVELIVSNGTTDSTPATLRIGSVTTLNDGAALLSFTDPADIRFSDIRTILQEPVTYGCTMSGCHTNPTVHPSGPPVYYGNYDRDGDADTDADDLHQFYLDVRARVNFTDIEASRILFRPSGHHHPGGLRPNFDTSVTPGSAGRGAYDIFLNWILHGAPE